MQQNVESCRLEDDVDDGRLSAAVRDIASTIGHGASVLQIGANDGVTTDPLYDCIREMNWSAILVEPIPELCNRLRRNYEGLSSVRIDQVAVSDCSGRRRLYHIAAKSGDPVWAEQLGSFHREVIGSHVGVITDINERILETIVDVVTVSDLLTRHNVQTLDLLYVDTEGHDDVILQSIDFNADWAPRFIVYEHDHLGDRRRGLEGLLIKNGYTLEILAYDTVASR